MNKKSTIGKKPNKKKIAFKSISVSVENSKIYRHHDWRWLIVPEKKEWIINISDCGYLFYNYEFFHNLFNYLNMDCIVDKKYIKLWVKEVLGFEVGENCWSDYQPDDYGDDSYNWKDQFNVEEVLVEGTPLIQTK